MGAERFMADETLQRAFVRSLEIATKKVPDEFRAPYFGVDYELVWDVVQDRIPVLRRQIASIIDA